MPTLESTLDIRSDQHADNRAAMARLLGVMNELQAEAALGGGEEAANRLAARGKLPIRERIANALDPDSPFLEISPLAAWRTSYNVGSGLSLIHI